VKILITGGSGSFGQAFTKKLLDENLAERIVIFSRGEHLQEDMAREFNDDRLRFFIGDVRDHDRLEMAMHGVDTVIHAAALKIVPTAEYNPTECIATNVTGSENVVKSAIRAGVQRVVALSTDKAVNPINLYGASKLAAEKIFVAASALAAGQCSFSVVRYGNVMGSQGSVVPLFKKLRAEGRDLTITDERMTRFHITMDQAVDLVEKAVSLREDGRIHIPRIPSVRVVDLAEAIDPGGKKTVVGIRAGEKLHECLMTEDESRTAVNRNSIYTIHPNGYTPLRHETRVPEGFRYTSDSNNDWLNVEQIRAAL